MTERSNIDESTYLQEVLPLDTEQTPARPALKVLDTTRLEVIDKKMDELVDEMSEGHVQPARYRQIESELADLRAAYITLTYVPTPPSETYVGTTEETYAPLPETSGDHDPYPVPLPDVEIPEDGGKTLYDLTVGPRIKNGHSLDPLSMDGKRMNTIRNTRR